MPRRILGRIPTSHLADVIRSAESLGDHDRIGFAWRGEYVEATVAAIRTELARRERDADGGRRRLQLRSLRGIRAGHRAYDASR